MTQTQIKDKPNRITTKQIIKEISKRTDYHIYEIEDMFDAFRFVLTENLIAGNEVKLDHMFSVVPKDNPPRPFMNPLTGAIETSKGSKSVLLRQSMYLKNCLNGKNAVDAENTENTNED